MIWIVAAFINVVMQELLVRGYIYQLLKKDYNIFMAVIVSTVLFTAVHLGAFEAGFIPVLNVITMYLFTTVLYETERNFVDNKEFLIGLFDAMYDDLPASKPKKKK